MSLAFDLQVGRTIESITDGLKSPAAASSAADNLSWARRLEVGSCGIGHLVLTLGPGRLHVTKA